MTKILQRLGFENLINDFDKKDWEKEFIDEIAQEILIMASIRLITKNNK